MVVASDVNTIWEEIEGAIENGNLEEVKVLLNSTGRIYFREKVKLHAKLLMKAAVLGKIDIAKFCIEQLKVNVHVMDDQGATALLNAALYGQLHVVKYIVESGADVNYGGNMGGWYPLHMAILGEHQEVIYYLLEKGADILAIDGRGGSAIEYAAAQDNVELVFHLAARGACVKRLEGRLSVSIVENFLEGSRAIKLEEYDVLSNILKAGQLRGRYLQEIEKLKERLDKILVEAIEKTPDFVRDPSKMFILYRGDLYKNLIGIYSRDEEQEEAYRTRLLTAIYIAIQAKVTCERHSEGNKHGDAKKRQKRQENEKLRFKELLGDELYESFKKEIEKVVKEGEQMADKENGFAGAMQNKNDHWLIAMKIQREYLKSKKDTICGQCCIIKSCERNVKSALTSCWNKAKQSGRKCVKNCLKKGKICFGKDRQQVQKSRSDKGQLQTLSHKCKTRGTFALVSCSLSVVFYILDIITDFTVGLEDYNGFSKKLGVFQMLLVIFTLMHENLRSSNSLYCTEEELLRIKLGREHIKPQDWIDSNFNKSETKAMQLVYMMFWPFVVRTNKGVLSCCTALLYNLLTTLQLRPVVDRLRVLLHSPSSLRAIYRHRAGQDFLRQFYLITEQIPELLIQFYTLQIVFNIPAAQFEKGKIDSTCGSERNFTYPRFTDSLNNLEEQNWFCGMLPSDSVSSTMACDIFFRLFSAMIPFFMIPSGIVSLEIGFRLLDPVTPKMPSKIRYSLQAAYTLMIPARLLMFAALMHSISKEIVFGYIIFRAILELLFNLRALKMNNSTTSKTDKTRKKVKENCWSWCFQLAKFLEGTVWSISMFGTRDLFSVSIREPQAYMKCPSEVTYHSIRNWKIITLRCLVFQLEGIAGAWLVEEYYPCGRHSEVFRYVGWMCLMSLLLSVTLMTLISDLLHPRHLLARDKTLSKNWVKSAGVNALVAVVSSLVFVLTRHRTLAEKWTVIVIFIVYLVACGLAMLQLIVELCVPRANFKKEAHKNNTHCCSCSMYVCFSCCCCISGNNPDYVEAANDSEEL